MHYFRNRICILVTKLLSSASKYAYCWFVSRFEVLGSNASRRQQGWRNHCILFKHDERYVVVFICVLIRRRISFVRCWHRWDEGFHRQQLLVPRTKLDQAICFITFSTWFKLHSKILQDFLRSSYDGNEKIAMKLAKAWWTCFHNDESWFNHGFPSFMAWRDIFCQQKLNQHFVPRFSESFQHFPQEFPRWQMRES